MESQYKFLDDLQATKNLGREIGLKWLAKSKQSKYNTQSDENNPIVLLKGDLGAGKTSLTKGIAESLGINEPITSPTFALAHHYDGHIAGLRTF